MTPPYEKTATMNFRVGEDVPKMLGQLAEAAGLTKTDYITTVIRAAYKQRFPKKASAFETPAEQLERDLLAQDPRQERYRRDLDAAFAEATGDDGPLVAPMNHALRARNRFDAIMGSERGVAVEAEWTALKAVRHFQQEASRQTEAAAVKAMLALAAYYDEECGAPKATKAAR
ncbi:MAG: hypothetical protein ACRELB_04350 [Polyangiaceae bacterium]